MIPQNPLIEELDRPIKWLYDLALKEGNHKRPIYQIHKWWARRLSSTFRALLLLSITPNNIDLSQFKANFYQEHDINDLVVLDPFMGGGTSIIESCKVNAKVIGLDIDPIAWFVTKKEIEPFNRTDIFNELSKLYETVGKEIQSYYQTKTPDGKYTSTIYHFWVDIITCPKCKYEFEGHPHYILSEKNKKKIRTTFCSNCHRIYDLPYSITNIRCEYCGTETKIDSGTINRGNFTCPMCNYHASLLTLSTIGVPIPKKLFAVEYEYIDNNGKLLKNYKPADEYDLDLINKASSQLNTNDRIFQYPRIEIPSIGRNDPRPINHGYKYYYQLFNSRQLLCLSILFEQICLIPNIQTREYLLLAFSDCLASNNMLCRYAFGYQKLTPLFGIHAFDIVNRPVENNVWGTKFGRGSFIKCVNKMIKGKIYAEKPYEINSDSINKREKLFTGETIISKTTNRMNDWKNGNAKVLLLNKPASNIDEIEDQSIDLILTDPPYFDNLSYSELSDFYYSWLKIYISSIPDNYSEEFTPYKNALFVNGNTEENHFANELSKILTQCRRTLKTNGILVFTFHHRKSKAWENLAKALWLAKFKITNVFPVRSEGRSGFHSSDGTIKWDSVITCRPLTNLPNNILSNSHIPSTISEKLTHWDNLLSKQLYDFQWVDKLSLGYSLGLEAVINKPTSMIQIEEDIKVIKKYLLSLLSNSQIKNLN